MLEKQHKKKKKYHKTTHSNDATLNTLLQRTRVAENWCQSKEVVLPVIYNVKKVMIGVVHIEAESGSSSPRRWAKRGGESKMQIGKDQEEKRGWKEEMRGTEEFG